MNYWKSIEHLKHPPVKQKVMTDNSMSQITSEVQAKLERHMNTVQDLKILP